MTLQEAKDETARNHGYDQWREKIHENGADFMEKLIAEVAELYASSKPSGRYTMEQMIDFAQWYSGMERPKVIAAYIRYLRETQNP